MGEGLVIQFGKCNKPGIRLVGNMAIRRGGSKKGSAFLVLNPV
jgi:hypothetical protein